MAGHPEFPSARLRQTFRAEAGQRIRALGLSLLDMERGSPEQRHEALDKAFRDAHSLKGAANAVASRAIEASCHVIESVMAGVKAGTLTAQAELFDRLHALLAAIERCVADDAGAESELGAAVDALLAHPGADPAAVLAAGKPGLPSAARRARATPAAGPRVEAGADTSEGPPSEWPMMDELLARTQGLGLLPEVSGRQLDWLRQLRARLDRPSPATADRSAGLLASLRRDLDEEVRRATRHCRQVEAQVQGLQALASRAAMRPLQELFDGLPIVARQLARAAGKEVELQLLGGEVEAEGPVLDELRDAVVQLVRNAVDHGLELQAQRLAGGKPRVGRVTLQARTTEAGGVAIEVADDGRGVDLAALRRAADAAGLAGQAWPPDDIALCDLLCAPGLSTRQAADAVSGRGVGLAIVRERLQRLGGRLSLRSKAGQGVTWRLELPASRYRRRAVVVRVGGQQFCLATHDLARVHRLQPGQAQRPWLTLEDRSLPLRRLDALTGRDLGGPVPPVALLLTGEAPLALAVDEVVRERDVFVMPFGHPIQRLRGFAGMALLDHGELLPMLHVPDLLALAEKAGLPAGEAPGEREAPRRRLLVAEDSMTTREMLRGMLEAAGYEVDTAADGLGAWALLRDRRYAALISDADMPGLDGIALTRRVRADPGLGDLPVVLVTALDGPEDRRRGVEAGVDAYLAKSRFQESALLDILERVR